MVDPAQDSTRDHRQWVELDGPAGQRHGFLLQADDRCEHRKPAQSLRTAGRQLDRFAQGNLGALEVPQIPVLHQPQGQVGLGEIRLQGDRALRGRVRLGVGLDNVGKALEARDEVGPRELLPRERVAGIQLDRLLQAFDALRETLLRDAVHEVTALEEQPVRLAALAAPARRRGRHLGPGFPADAGVRSLTQEGSAKLLHHGLRNVVLHRKDVVQRPVVALRPQVEAVLDLHQLDRDAEPLAGLADAALEHRRDPQRAPDFGDRGAFAFERKCRGARRDAQPADLAEDVQELLGQAVGEVLVVLVAAQVGEGEHRDRRRVLRSRLRGGGPGCFQRLLHPAEIVVQLERRLEAVARLLLEAAADDAIELAGKLRAQLGERGRRVAQNGRADIGGRVAGEGAAAARQLVDHDPEGEEIGARVGRLAADLLGRHVRHRAHDLADRGDRPVERLRDGEIGRDCGHSRLGQPEVEHFETPVPGQHHVGRLEVAMDDPALVRRRQRVGQRDGQLQDAGHRQPAGSDVLFAWLKPATVRASRWKRASRSGSRAKSAGRVFSATSRPSRVSRARYTSPMPPAPSCARIS